jgi:hypothetical protein
MKRYLIIFIFLYSFKTFAQSELHLVSYTLIKSHTKETIKTLFKSKHIPGFIMPVKNDVDIYEIIYKAKWVDGTWRNASGIYYAPKLSSAVPYFMYGHGTQIEKNRSISDNDAQQNICLMFATDGYAAMYPDYYGIGKGDGKHLYQHAWSEAGAFIYMLYAIDELNKILSIKHNGQLFLTGYSQGGHASMAAHKYIEELNDPRFKVTASSPMSGAYDMTGEQEKYMFEEYPRPFYLPYLLLSYQEAYGIYKDKDIYSAFKEPFDTILPKYFENNKDKSFNDLNKIMPKIPKDIMKDSLVKVYINNDDFEFKERLCENNLTCWKPEAPVMLCFCKGDREVNYKNSLVAYRDMKGLGATEIKLNNLSDKLDHNTCAAFAVLSTKYFFNRYKKRGKNPRMKDLPRFKKFLIGFGKRKEEKKYLSGGKDKAYI